MRRLVFFLSLCLLSTGIFAWTVDLSLDANNQPQVVVASELSLENTDVYLVWFDKDATGEQAVLVSWQHEQKTWLAGLHRAFTKAVDIPVFPDLKVAPLEQSCPDSHVCFLAFIATASGDDPFVPSNWLEGELLPLSIEATQQRLAGQTRFSLNTAAQRYADDGILETLTDAAGTAAPPAIASSDSSFSGATPATTEKPDVFRLEGEQILYANGRAERFQIIDVNDLNNPALIASERVSGSPREVYRLGEYYGLLQTAYNDESKLSIFSLNQAQLTLVDEFIFEGHFMQSRRRNEVVYALTQDYSTGVWIYALSLNAEGKIQLLKKEALSAYNPVVAIFPDYLVLAGWGRDDFAGQSVVQVFDLSQTGSPLVPLEAFAVGGYIPSEFHLYIQQNYLSLVSGPEDRSQGSSLSIYDLSSGAPIKQGEVSNIAPGERLYATRFEFPYAYVVTYRNTDPLWVIDISQPSAPFIAGHLEVPGWSEKLFFNQGRLFAVGIDDTAGVDELDSNWYRRVAMSLFDVKDPLNPQRLSQFTPLAGMTNYSYSNALSDERALLLDWQDSYAALPLSSGSTGKHVQVVTFADNQLRDAGRFDFDTSIQRSLELAPQTLGLLGDQFFYTATWGQTGTAILGEVELARDLSWVQNYAADVWAIGRNTAGMNSRLYRYNAQDLEHEQQQWTLQGKHYYLVHSPDWLVSYGTAPFSAEVFDIKNKTLHSSTLAETERTYTYGEFALVNGDNLYYFKRSNTVLPYLGALESTDKSLISEPSRENSNNSLTRWHISSQGLIEENEYSIPGTALGFNEAGLLLSREPNIDGLRLNLIKLNDKHARLLNSMVLDCYSYSTALWQENALYLLCNGDNYYYPYYSSFMDVGVSSPAPTERKASILYKITADKQLRISGRWELPAEGSYSLYAAAADTVMVSSYQYFQTSTSGLLAPDYYGSNQCAVYRLNPTESTVQSLYSFDSHCPYGGVDLQVDGMYSAEGYVGLNRLTW